MRLDALSGDVTVESRLLVPGMRCAGCIAKIEGGLTATPGIAAARVHFATRQLRIAHEPAIAMPELMARLSDIGFESQPLSSIIDEGQGELKPLLLALAVAAFGAMNIMLLSVSVWSGADGATRQMFHWLSAAIGIATVGYAGRPFFKSAWAALRRGRTNMDVPISIGLILTTAMSLFETIIGGEHVWFDGATMLCAFLLGGRVLDAMMRERAREGVAALLRQAPTGASVMADDGSTQWMPAEQIRPGMRLLVATGERVAADAIVDSGESALDRSLITGESDAVPVRPGDVVEAGTLNRDAPLVVRVTAAPEDSSLADIARLMEAAGQGRSAYTRIADRAARLYAPAVHLLAALSFAGWMLAGAGWHQSLLIAIAVLLITCPCALGLAVPVAQVVASGAMMRAGLLVKDGSALERLATVDRTLLDKTGTLTMGQPRPVDLTMLDETARSVALALAQASHHPLSRGLAAALRDAGVVPASVTDLGETPGEGMRGIWQGEPVTLGRPSSGGNGVALQLPGRPVALIAFADPLRPDADAAIARLNAMNVPASIISGDHLAGVSRIADATGLEAIADARPADKIALVERLQREGQHVVMVGDGLNDGPALAAATAAIAPASASDVGRQAADILFLNDSLLSVPRAIAAARRTMAVIRQNFALAIGYNVIAVPLAIAGYVTPLIAALAMSGSSLIVIANALRLQRAAR